MPEDPTDRGGTVSTYGAEIDLLAAVAHELKTQLGIVLTASELLAMAELPEREARYVGMLRGAAVTLQALLDDLLDNTRLKSGTLPIESVPFRPHELIEDLVNAFRTRLADKAVDVVLHAETETDQELVGDPLRLRQIVTNLLDNAAKFTDAGEIAVTVTADCDAEGCRLEVIVADTGIGFDAEDAESIFAPFWRGAPTVDQDVAGTGLGLAISRGLAARMGGTLTAEGKRGAGARFTLSVPLGRAPQSAAPEAPDRAAAEAPDLTGFRVLVVDDNAVIRRLLVTILDQFGVDHDAVEGGEAALARVAKKAFDLVILDVRMNGTDGIATAKRIRAGEASRSLPLIALSAHPAAQVRASSADLFDAVLEKPLKAGDLYEVLCRFAGKA